MKFLRRGFNHALSLRRVGRKTNRERKRCHPGTAPVTLCNVMALATGTEISLGRAFPCHPEITLPKSRSRWLRCPACGTQLRNESIPAGIYNDEYPAARSHHDSGIGRCKV